MALENPNALIGGIGGIGGGQIVVNLAGLLGWDISTGWALAVSGIATYVVLFVGKSGFSGVWNLLKYGTGGKPEGVK